jgi:hypothetical protein
VTQFHFLGSFLGLSPEDISLSRVGWILVAVCRVMMKIRMIRVVDTLE